MLTPFCLYAGMSLIAAGGTYEVGSAAHTARIMHKKSASTTCFRMEPSMSFTVHGPARIAPALWIDLPKRPRRPKFVRLQILVDDDKPRKQKLRPKRSRVLRYADVDGKKPSAPLAAKRIVVGPGRHEIEISLPARRSGCVALSGVSEMTPKDEATLQPVIAETFPVDSGAPPTVVTKSESTRVSAEVSALETNTPNRVEEIRAAPVGNVVNQTNQPEPEADMASSVADRLRLGVVFGGVLPRGDLKPGLSAALLVDVSLFKSSALSVFAEAGYSPMRQQDDAFIEGRGLGGVIQETAVFPADIGIRYKLELPGVHPYVLGSIAMDVTRSTLRAFSLPEETRTSTQVGASIGIGAYLLAGAGGILVELRYRELSTVKLGRLGNRGAAETALGRVSLLLGYLLPVL